MTPPDDVSRETLERLQEYVALLRRWQRSINLIAPSTLESVWERHVWDSWQLTRLGPLDGDWIDLGSGAGFPGLVVAIAMAAGGRGRVTLVESDQRKAAFLREAARLTGAPASVRNERAEAVAPAPHHVVTARALAPLPDLLALVQPFVAAGAVALLPKGERVAEELTRAAARWSFDHVALPNGTDSRGVILRVTRVAPRPGPEERQ